MSSCHIKSNCCEKSDPTFVHMPIVQVALVSQYPTHTNVYSTSTAQVKQQSYINKHFYALILLPIACIVYPFVIFLNAC